MKIPYLICSFVALFIFASASVFFFYAGLGPSASRSAGRYKANYLGGTEFLELNPNGKYAQKFILNGKQIFANAGNWGLSNSKEELIFDDFTDAISGGSCSLKPNKPAYGLGIWYQISHTISMNEDCGQVYRRY